MTKYFESFPTINYNGYNVTDITRRNRFTQEVRSNPYAYMPYTVKEGERPEDIANWYYGSVDYVWLVYYANNIIDPYHQWYLDEYNFNKYLSQKYESQSGLKGDDVVDWTRDPNNDENIIYYYREV